MTVCTTCGTPLNDSTKEDLSLKGQLLIKERQVESLMDIIKSQDRVIKGIGEFLDKEAKALKGRFPETLEDWL